MLYDILLIDDDFDKQSDSTEWESNAQKLFLELIRDNLRVTYTTGELEDLEKLKSKDLSCIKYIFCDLHLLGISENSSKIKDIASKLKGIFEELNKNIKSEELTVFINSKFSDEWTEVQDEGFKSGVDERYTFKLVNNNKLVNNKNDLMEEDKKKLLENNLNLHIKSFIIAKAVEVEEIFDKKLRLTEKSKERVNFESKRYVLQSQFDLDNKVRKELQLLQEIRNKAAHSDNNFNGIKDKEMRKTFWGTCSKPECEENIEFTTFQQLVTYIESIEQLKNILLEVSEK